jgi:hypothetical protein
MLPVQGNLVRYHGEYAMQIATGRVSGVRGKVKGEAGEIYPLIELHKARI